MRVVQAVSLLVLMPICARVATPGDLLAQSTKAPALLQTAGNFKVLVLTSEPVLDEREWIEANVQSTFEDGAVPVPTREFSLTATGCDAVGDFSRCKLLFQSGRAGTVLIDRGFTGWVYVTPDARYVFTEPLYVLDVRDWTQYALFDALGIKNYVSIDAISRDGRRLVISRTDCPFDCRGEQRRQYYELTLPK